MIPVILVALAAGIVVLVFGRFDRKQALQRWDFVLSGRAEKATEALRTRLAEDTEIAGHTYDLALKRKASLSYDEAVRLLAIAADTIEEWFHEAGWEIICKTDRVNPPGYSIHEVGTCRMGDDPKRSVLNKWCQSHDVKNLFVVDGASFVTCGWQNPTMTILSLSMRASEYLADEMRTNSI